MAGQVLRGEIYRLKPKRDRLHRITDAGKPRPILVMSVNVLNLGNDVLAIPFSSRQLEKRRHMPSCAFFQQGEAGLDCDCVAQADKLTLLDKTQIDLAGGPLGRLDDAQMERVVRTVTWSLGIDGKATR